MRVPRRVMVVSDRSGMGKTDLLRKLRLKCERDHEVAVALILLEEFVGLQDEFTVVDHLHSALTSTGASFPQFDAAKAALRNRTVAALTDGVGAVAGVVDLTGASVSGHASISAVTINMDTVNFGWSDELDAYARRRCVNAFIVDLKNYVQENPVALLFDGLEKISDALRRWIVVDIVRQCLTDDWPSRKMVVVLAGVDVIDMILGRLPRTMHDCVLPAPSFGAWSQEQVGEFLAAHDVAGLRPTEIALLHGLLGAGGHTLTSLLVVASTIVAVRQA
jgi:hypothetical protein